MAQHDQLAVITLARDASISLPLDGLSDKTKRQISFVVPEHPSLVDRAIAQASVVLISRELQTPPIKYAVNACINARKPFYYYTDDNFWLLADELTQYACFGTPEADGYLRAATGIVVSTDALARFVLSNGIHDNVLKLGPVLDRSLLQGHASASADDGIVTLAFVGSIQRNDVFAAAVEPAIARLWREGVRLRVVVRAGSDMQTLSFHGIPTVQQPLAKSFAEYIATWRRFRPDVLVHPHVESKNAPYKTSSVILSACLLGAVPVVGAEPAFAGLSERDGVHVVADKTADTWASALSALREAKARARSYRSLLAYCESVFRPNGNEKTIARLLQTGRTAVGTQRTGAR